MDISIGGADTLHGKNTQITCVSKFILIGFAFETRRLQLDCNIDRPAYNIGYMKSFVVGLVTIIILGIAGFYAFKGINSFVKGLNPSPSATPSLTPTLAPSLKPSAAPKTQDELSTSKETTKGGLPTKSGSVKGATTTKTVTTTTTTSHLFLTLVKTSICPISYMTEVKDMTGPLTLKYKLIDNTSFGITIWNSKGEELLQNTTYSGNSGTIKTISGVDYMKIRVESKNCAGNNDNWLTLTGER
jgi:hypothetical protein